MLLVHVLLSVFHCDFDSLSFSSEPLTHVNSCGVAILITPTFVRLKRDPHLMGLNVLLEK